MTTFAELGLSEPVLRAITELGYEEPTPIQAQTIQRVSEGVDIIAQAQTGTGKTAAFALPVIEKLEADQRTPQALILTPTRELAVQVAEACHNYGKYKHVQVLPVYGGQPIGRQLMALQRGVQIVVGTPGRLLDHIRRGTLKLDGVRTVVLDEADEMLDMGFIEDIEAILQETPDDRQTLLFSATIPGPIGMIAKRYMKDPQRISVAAEKMTVALTRQVYYEVGGRDKFEVLARILDFETPTSAIIFCRTKSAVDDLGQRLTARAYQAETLHGDLSQIQRDRVMARFRANSVEILVATDVAARGLDIEHVSHVVNYDIPLDPESYVHRIGRTGRAGRAGVAITLVTPRERRQLRIIEGMIGQEIQRMRLPTIADVIARRREAFKESLREAVAAGGLESYTILVEELGEEYDPIDLAAAAFKLLLSEPEVPAEDTLAQQEVEERRPPRTAPGDFGDRPTGSRSGGGRFGPERGMSRLYLDIGRDDNVRPADIVGAIANEAGIPGRAVGSIELYDRFAFVEVPEQMAERVLKALKRTTIRGRKIAPTIARPQVAIPR
ncbi:MAG: DEAD/DEAH box helicase [Herpetosiphonaceae bacterium]|nr:DEAD/DEAH box helicase [Herpetosiphonaceae bacterium]